MTLPDPLTPPDCDCTDLDGFMLNVEKLMASELVALASHEEVAAALFLWCRAWKQKPAASLPDDDRVIAAYAKLPLPRFKKVRAAVLRGFVKCNDGRLYHSTLAEEALNAYARKLAFRNKRDGDAERLRKWREERRRNKPGNYTEKLVETRFKPQRETPTETRFVAEGQGQGQGQGQGRDNPESQQPYEPAAAADENEWSKLEWTLRQAAGLGNAPLASLSNLSIIVGRMKAGMSLDDVILPAIRSVAARGGKGRSWAYYADAIDEYAASMAGAGKAAKAVPKPQVDDLAHEPTVPVLGGNEVRVSLIHRIWGNETWNAAWGPEPGRDGCYLPEEMQRELLARRSVAA